MTDTLKSPAALELLKRTYQHNVMASRSEGCPSDETLAALVLGELDASRRDEISDHVVSCQHCAEAFRVLRQLHARAYEERTRARKWLGLASAAALVLGLAGYAMLGTTPESADDVLRSAPAADIEPGDGAVLSSPPSSLSWTAEPGATGYRVRLFATDGSLLWESPETSEVRIAVPTEAGLSAGTAYLWSVTVIGPTRRSELGPFTFALQ